MNVHSEVWKYEFFLLHLFFFHECIGFLSLIIGETFFTQIFLLSAFSSVSTHAEHSTHQEFPASNETEIKFFVRWFNHMLPKTTTNKLQAPFQILPDFNKKSLRDNQWFVVEDYLISLSSPTQNTFHIWRDVGLPKSTSSQYRWSVWLNIPQQGREVAQLAKGLPCKHQDLCLIPGPT